MVVSSRVLLVAFVFAASLAVVTSIRLVSASISLNPINTSTIHDVQWANVTDKEFTVAWITDAAIPGGGSVIYGLSPSTAFTSIGEKPPPAGARGDVHVVQVPNLSASTSYYVAVAAGGIQDTNEGDYYKITTGPVLTPLANPGSVSASVNLAGGLKASGVLVLLKILDNNNLNGSPSTTSATLAAVTNSTGNWSLSLNPRTSDSSSVFNYTTDGTNDFVQYTVEAGALGDGGTQTVLLRLDGTGHLQVTDITVAVPAATYTPSVTTTPTVTPSATVTSTATQTSTPTVTATLTNAVDNQVQAATPTDTPQLPVPTAVPSPTPVAAPVVEPRPPLVEAPQPQQMVQPTPVPRPVPATSTPVVDNAPRPGAATPLPTQTTVVAPATPFEAPRFPFGGTPLALAIGASQAATGPTASPIVTPSVLNKPSGNDRLAATARPAVESEGLPPVAVLLFAAGLAAIGLGIAVVTFEVSRRLRNS
jgi:hypothetical protein